MNISDELLQKIEKTDKETAIDILYIIAEDYPIILNTCYDEIFDARIDETIDANGCW